MPPVGDFKYDVFVSFAVEDNAPSSTTDRQLVSGIVDTLRAQTAATGQVCKFFFQDSPIQDRDRWEAIVRPAVAQSRILLPVVSNHYFASLTCQWEWEVFQSTLAQRHNPFADDALLGPVQPLLLPEVTDVPEHAAAWRSECNRYTHLAMPQAPSLLNDESADTSADDGGDATDVFREQLATLNAYIDRRIFVASDAAVNVARDSGNMTRALSENRHALDVASRSVERNPQDVDLRLSLAGSHLSLSGLSADTDHEQSLTHARQALSVLDKVEVPASEWPNPNLQSVVLGHLADLEAGSQPDVALTLRQRAVSSGELAWQSHPDCLATTEILASHLEELAAAQNTPKLAHQGFLKAAYLRRRLIELGSTDTDSLRHLVHLAGRSAEAGLLRDQVPSRLVLYPSGVDGSGESQHAELVSAVHRVADLLQEAGTLIPVDSAAGCQLLEEVTQAASAFLAASQETASSDAEAELLAKNEQPDEVATVTPADRDATASDVLDPAELQALYFDSCLWAAKLTLHAKKSDSCRSFVAITSAAYLAHENDVDSLHAVADFLESAGREANTVLPREASDTLLLAAMCWDADADHYGSEESMLQKTTAVFQAAELRLLHGLDSALGTAVATIQSALDLMACFPNRPNAHAADQVIGSITDTMSTAQWTSADVLEVVAYRDELVAQDQQSSTRSQDYEVDTVLVTAIRLSATLARARGVDVDSQGELTTARALSDCLNERATDSKQTERIAQAVTIRDELRVLSAAASADETRSSHSWLTRGLAGVSSASS